METKHEWPARIKLRDTKIYADEGQRIYTTATGYGYEKMEYVRLDLFQTVCEQWKLLVDKYGTNE